MNLYECNSIKDIVAGFISDQKTLGNKLTLEQLAGLLRMQKSYLSKIMHGHAHLNHDQAYLLSKTLGLKDEEQDYLFLLIERDRAGIEEYKKMLEKKIKTFQNLNTQSQNYLDKETNSLTSSELQMYYLYAELQLIHLAFDLPQFQKHPEKIKQVFKISDTLYQKIIQILQNLKLIKIENNQVKLLRANLHLPQDSFFFHQWQLQLKLKSMEKIKELETHDKYNFTVSFTASENDKEEIRLAFMQFLKKVEKIVDKAEPTHLYQMNFDLFNWTS